MLHHVCIGCGNCVLVCGQDAKEIYSSIGAVREILEQDGQAAAIVAPSFPIECEDIGHKKYVGMIKALGFSRIYEVALGADLVAREYRKLIQNNPEKSYISSACPAIVAFIKY